MHSIDCSGPRLPNTTSKNSQNLRRPPPLWWAFVSLAFIKNWLTLLTVSNNVKAVSKLIWNSKFDQGIIVKFIKSTDVCEINTTNATAQRVDFREGMIRCLPRVFLENFGPIEDGPIFIQICGNFKKKFEDIYFVEKFEELPKKFFEKKKCKYKNK